MNLQPSSQIDHLKHQRLTNADEHNDISIYTSGALLRECLLEPSRRASAERPPKVLRNQGWHNGNSSKSGNVEVPWLGEEGQCLGSSLSVSAARFFNAKPTLLNVSRLRQDPDHPNLVDEVCTISGFGAVPSVAKANHAFQDWLVVAFQGFGYRYL